MCSAQSCPSVLESKVETLVDQFAPFKTQKVKHRNSIYWCSSAVKKLVKLKKQAFLEFARTGFNKEAESWEAYKAIRNKTTNGIKDAKKKAMSEIIEDSTLTQWQKIKILQGSNSTNHNKIEELEFDGRKYTDGQEISNKLNVYFSSIGAKLNQAAKSSYVNSNASTGNQDCDATATVTFDFGKFEFQEVTNCDVAKILQQLRPRKTGGLNQIPAFIYKILEPLILNPLTHIINLSLNTSQFPDIWKKALVIPIHKGNSKTLPNNYRPISLLPVLSKILEKLINFQVREYIDTHELIESRQFGFRAGTSTDQILLQLVNKFRHKLCTKNSKFVTLAALDIKKAFDCVNHHILLEKLESYFNFSTSAKAFIHNYLTNREQAMKVNGYLSDKSQIITGVPQGSVLGPLLFIIFINDLMKLENSYLFADDCLLITSGEDPAKSTCAMEKTITKASKWYDENLLVLNAAKTDVMTISNSKISAPNLNFKNLSFKQSDKIKYLGVILDDKLCFKPHIKKVKQKLYPIITSFQRNRKFLNSRLAALWYKGLIRPNLEYCAPILHCTGATIKHESERIENRCLKIINFNDSKIKTRDKHNIHHIYKRFEYLFLMSFYKLINGLVPVIDHGLLPEKLKSNTRLAGHDGLRQGRAEFGFSLNCYAAKLYNDLPPDIKLCSTIKNFKKALRCHVLISGPIQ